MPPQSTAVYVQSCPADWRFDLCLPLGDLRKLFYYDINSIKIVLDLQILANLFMHTAQNNTAFRSHYKIISSLLYKTP